MLDDFGQLGRAWRETGERAAEAKAASQARPSFGKFNYSAQPILVVAWVHAAQVDLLNALAAAAEWLRLRCRETWKNETYARELTGIVLVPAAVILAPLLSR